MERAPSALMAAVERRDSADTARGMPVSAHVVPEQAGEGAQEAKAEVELVQETEGRARAGSVGSVSTTSSASAIEGEDEAEGAEDESPRDAEDDEDEDDMKVCCASACMLPLFGRLRSYVCLAFFSPCFLPLRCIVNTR